MWSKSTVIKLLKLKLVDVYFLVLITVWHTVFPSGIFTFKYRKVTTCRKTDPEENQTH